MAREVSFHKMPQRVAGPSLPPLMASRSPAWNTNMPAAPAAALVASTQSVGTRSISSTIVSAGITSVAGEILNVACRLVSMSSAEAAEAVSVLMPTITYMARATAMAGAEVSII